MVEPFILQEGRYYRLTMSRTLWEAERTEHGWGEHEVLDGTVIQCTGPVRRRGWPIQTYFVPVRARTSTGEVRELLLRTSKRGAGPRFIEPVDPLTLLADCDEAGLL